MKTKVLPSVVGKLPEMLEKKLKKNLVGV